MDGAAADWGRTRSLLDLFSREETWAVANPLMVGISVRGINESRHHPQRFAGCIFVVFQKISAT